MNDLRFHDQHDVKKQEWYMCEMGNEGCHVCWTGCSMRVPTVCLADADNSDGYTALHCAALGGHAGCVDALLAAQADTAAVSSADRSAILVLCLLLSRHKTSWKMVRVSEANLCHFSYALPHEALVNGKAITYGTHVMSKSCIAGRNPIPTIF